MHRSTCEWLRDDTCCHARCSGACPRHSEIWTRHAPVDRVARPQQQDDPNRASHLRAPGGHGVCPHLAGSCRSAGTQRCVPKASASQKGAWHRRLAATARPLAAGWAPWGRCGWCRRRRPACPCPGAQATTWSWATSTTPSVRAAARRALVRARSRQALRRLPGAGSPCAGCRASVRMPIARDWGAGDE